MDAEVEDAPPKIQTKSNETHENINRISVETKFILDRNDLTVTMYVSICNEPMKFLIDCGAHATMIKAKKLRSNILYYPQVKYCLTGINGPKNPLKTHGATYGNIIFNGIKLKQQMQIAGDDVNMNYDGILGIDFLRQYNATISLRKMSMNLLLPAWHELHEAREREEYEKKESIKKRYENNELIYFSNTNGTQFPKNDRLNEVKPPKIKQKMSELNAHINRLQLHHISKKPLKQTVKILPFSQENFKILTDKPAVCKAKAYGDLVFSLDTIIDEKRNILSVYNASEKSVVLQNLDVESEALENYDMYVIEKAPMGDNQKRIKYILDNLKMAYCTETEKTLISELISEYHDVFHVEGDDLTFAKFGEHKIFTKPGVNPINTRQYRIPHVQREIANQKIKEMLRDDVIDVELAPVDRTEKVSRR